MTVSSRCWARRAGRVPPGLPPAGERGRGGQPTANGAERVGPAWCRRDARGCWGRERCLPSGGLSVPARVEAGRHRLNEKVQFTRTWWRRIAMSERSWKSAQPNSSLTCLYDCSTQCRSRRSARSPPARGRPGLSPPAARHGGAGSRPGTRWPCLAGRPGQRWPPGERCRPVPTSPVSRRRRTRSQCARHGRCGSPAVSRRDHAARPNASSRAALTGVRALSP